MLTHQVTKNPVENQWLGVILPAIYITVILTADYLVHIGTITPFFVVVALLYMALRCRPVVMIPWSVIYTVIVCSIFLFPKLFSSLTDHPYYDQYVIPAIRSATYIVVATLSCYLCLTLDRLKKTRNELNQILENLPWPIFTSDHHGMLLYWNESAAKLLPILREKTVLNYFDLLAIPELHGRTITNYLNRFDQNKHQEPIQLRVAGKSYKGHTQLIDWTDQKVMLTILSEHDVLSTFSSQFKPDA